MCESIIWRLPIYESCSSLIKDYKLHISNQMRFKNKPNMWILFSWSSVSHQTSEMLHCLYLKLHSIFPKTYSMCLALRAPHHFAILCIAAEIGNQRLEPITNTFLWNEKHFHQLLENRVCTQERKEENSWYRMAESRGWKGHQCIQRSFQS